MLLPVRPLFWDQHADRRSWFFATEYLHLPIQLAHPFRYVENFDTERGNVTVLQQRHVNSRVSHFHSNLSAFSTDADTGLGTLGVSMNIREAFLGNAEQGHFGLLSYSSQVLRDIRVHENTTAFRKSMHILRECRAETNFIQQRGMKKMRQGSRFGDRSVLNIRDVRKPFLYEKRRIARDVQDGLRQYLAAVKIHRSTLSAYKRNSRHSKRCEEPEEESSQLRVSEGV